MANETNETAPLSSMQAIEKMLKDDDGTMDPWHKMLYASLLDSYKGVPGADGQPSQPGGFAKRFEKYYAPFMVGASNVKQRDLIPNTYENPNPYDTPDQIKRKYIRNEHINKLSAADPFITKLSHGLGMAGASLVGGAPGIVGGMLLKEGAPLAWDLAKQYLAKKAGEKAASQERYKKLKMKYPTL
jgi:hypothetical protein